MKFEPVTTETKEVIIQENGFIPFRVWYDALSNVEKRKFRGELIRVSGMQFPTFYSKLRRNSFTPLEMKAMSEIIFSLMPEKFQFLTKVKFEDGEIRILYSANHSLD